MAAQLNHTIVWSSDQTMSARFLAEMLGRPAPTRFGQDLTWSSDFHF